MGAVVSDRGVGDDEVIRRRAVPAGQDAESASPDGLGAAQKRRIQSSSPGSRAARLVLLKSRVALAACLVLTPVSLLGLGCAAGGVSDQLDILNHATSLFFAAAVGLVAASLLLARPRLWVTLVGSICVVATGGILLTDRPLAVVRPDPGAPVVSIIEHNVWTKNAQPQRTADLLLARRADVVVLIEVSGAGRAVADRLRAAYPYATHCLDSAYCEMEIFSRYPIRAWSSHVGGWRPPENDFLMWVRADIDAGRAGPLTLYGAKLVHPGPNGVQARQIEGLVRQMAREEGDRRIVLTGDFNLTPWSFRLRRLDGALQQVASLHRVSRAVANWPARLPPLGGERWRMPLIGIDHFYAGPDWRLVSIKRLPATGSDHYPVEVRLTPLR